MSDNNKKSSELMLQLIEDLYLFHDNEGIAYAKLWVEDHYEVWNVESAVLMNYLIARYMQAYEGEIPSEISLRELKRVLKVKAQIQGSEHSVYTRIAELDDAIYISLCDEKWNAIEITKKGWKIISNPPVFFVRSPIMKELPRPCKNGQIASLHQFINAREEHDFHLIIAWLLSTFKENSPFPIMIIQGEQGSAKSTTTSILRTLIDPSTLTLRSLPKNEEELAISTKNAFVLAYDNISEISDNMSDNFCKMSTGGAISMRTLYTTAEETSIRIKRPCIFNGIEDIANRPDLLDRAIIINLSNINPKDRVDEKTFWKNFDELHGEFLGGLCNVVSQALTRLPKTKLEKKPRMADFALWVTAAEKSLGWSENYFMKIYQNNRANAIDQGYERNPLATAVFNLMEQRQEVRGTTGEILAQINLYMPQEDYQTHRGIPINQLKGRLRRIATLLRERNIEIQELPRTNRGTMLRIYNTKKLDTTI